MQSGQEDKDVIFTMTLIAWSGFNPHPGHVVESLDKTLFNDYLCLVASNKQQIQWKIKKFTGTLETRNYYAGVNSSNHEVVIAMKSAWINQYLPSDAVQWQEDKYAIQLQQPEFKWRLSSLSPHKYAHEVWWWLVTNSTN